MAKRVRYLRQVVSHLEEKYGKEKAQAKLTKTVSTLTEKEYDDHRPFAMDYRLDLCNRAGLEYFIHIRFCFPVHYI